MRAWPGLLAVLVLSAPACKKAEPVKLPPRDGKLGAQRCSGQAGPKNTVLPLLQRPFDGQFPALNLFDHELPLVSDFKPLVEGDKELTYCGIDALGLAEGFAGYAWSIPVGTPILAPADGVVLKAGVASNFHCVLTHQFVSDQLVVDLEHPTLGDIGFITHFAHLAKVTVKPGDKVVAGQRIGLAGMSGCAVTPATFFQVLRLTGTKTGRPTVVDPYGWDGTATDPWAEHPDGAPSVYLWQPGEAPTLKSK
ncbi:MAG: M23 family metallopeptidase [Myxococcaceae bacterium]|nr:M23 family metallopeptidase [Myxococcaceae bacterium]